MATKNNLEKIIKLKTYLEKCVRDAANETKTLEKRNFFKREIKKTEKAIESLTIS